MTLEEVNKWQKVASGYLDKAGIALTTEEQDTLWGISCNTYDKETGDL